MEPGREGAEEGATAELVDEFADPLLDGVSLDTTLLAAEPFL